MAKFRRQRADRGLMQMKTAMQDAVNAPFAPFS